MCIVANSLHIYKAKIIKFLSSYLRIVCICSCSSIVKFIFEKCVISQLKPEDFNFF